MSISFAEFIIARENAKGIRILLNGESGTGKGLLVERVCRQKSIPLTIISPVKLALEARLTSQELVASLFHKHSILNKINPGIILIKRCHQIFSKITVDPGLLTTLGRCLRQASLEDTNVVFTTNIPIKDLHPFWTFSDCILEMSAILSAEDRLHILRSVFKDSLADSSMYDYLPHAVNCSSNMRASDLVEFASQIVSIFPDPALVFPPNEVIIHEFESDPGLAESDSDPTTSSISDNKVKKSQSSCTKLSNFIDQDIGNDSDEAIKSKISKIACEISNVLNRKEESPMDPVDWVKDIWGHEEIKLILKTTLERLLDPLDKEHNSIRSSGIILHGPPGTGKTLLARAVASHISGKIPQNMNTGRFVSVSIPQLLHGTVGDTEKAIHSLFDDAIRLAPTVIFFDEFEGIANATCSGSSGLLSKIIGQKMDLISPLNYPNPAMCPRVLVLAATNLIDLIDPSLCRFGRFSPALEVGLLNLNEITRAFETLNLENNDHLGVKLTAMSGAEARRLVDQKAKI